MRLDDVSRHFIHSAIILHDLDLFFQGQGHVYGKTKNIYIANSYFTLTDIKI